MNCVSEVSQFSHPKCRALFVGSMVDEMTEREVTMFEYDEYTFHLAGKEGLREEIEGNMSNWLITGRTLEINEGASIVQDMKEALEIVGVSV